MASDPAAGSSALRINALLGSTGTEPLSGDTELNGFVTRGSRGRDPRHMAYEPEQHSSHHEPESGHKPHHQPEAGLNVRLLKV